MIVISSAAHRSPAMPDAPCIHARTQLIAKDNEAEYVECLDCGAILESSEKTDHTLDGSLADA
jgi:hypothetical protein